jgi:hypothetical protein
MRNVPSRVVLEDISYAHTWQESSNLAVLALPYEVGLSSAAAHLVLLLVT